MSKVVALDIETTGLRPEDHHVVAVAIAAASGSKVFVGEEATILAKVERHLSGLPTGSLVVTWNGEEFDLPFLFARFEAWAQPTSLVLRPRGTSGKYGKPQYQARWGNHPHLDIAPSFELRAQELQVKWSLKPVARALLGLDPVEVDNRGEAIAAMPTDALTRYVRSDAEITRSLAFHLVEAGELSAEDAARPA